MRVSARTMLRWIRVNVLPGLLSSILLLLIIVGIGEMYRRWTVPFLSSHYPGNYVDDVGLMNFPPGAEVRSTNRLSFWTVQTANSLGFLDREPASVPDPNACRIVILGDSFVQAVEVPIEQKLQVRLEQHLSRLLGGRRLEIVAAGVSGTGQVNQLKYLDTVVRPRRPHLVILIATANDFSNNSPMLSALRYGWHPDHMLRYFLKRDPVSGALIQVGPDPAANKHYLFLRPPLVLTYRRSRVVQWMSDRSYFFDWAYRLQSRRIPELRRWLMPDELRPVDIAVRRMEQIRAIPHYRDVFSGWQYPDDLFEDHVFRTDSLPPVFAEAEWLMRYAFQTFHDASVEQGFQVVVAAESLLAQTWDQALEKSIRATHGRDALTRDGALTRPVTMYGRTLLPAGALKRLTRIADAAGLPVIDLFTELSPMGDLEDIRVPYDGHWSAVGHDRVAQILARYIAAHPRLCGEPGGGS